MSYGLPAVTVIFTYFLPAGLQLSFFISGILSYCQSTAFKNASFREATGMVPLPPPHLLTPGAAPTSAPTIKLAPESYRVDSTKLNYEAPNRTSTLSGVSVDSVPEAEKTIFGGAKSTFQDGLKDAKDAFGKVKTTWEEKAGTKRVDGKRTKQEIKAAQVYEEKRVAELAKKRFEDEQRRMAQRRAKKMAGR